MVGASTKGSELIMSEAFIQLAKRLRRPQASLSGLDSLSDEQLQQLLRLIDAASEREHQRVQSQLRRGIFWPLRWLLQRRVVQRGLIHTAMTKSQSLKRRSQSTARRPRS